MYSFINIYDDLKTIATAHRQINTFGFGYLWEIASSGSVDYPMMFVQPDGATFGRGEVGMKYKIYILDKVINGEADEEEVLSDTQQMLLDVLATLKNNEASYHLKHDKIPLEDFTEKEVDNLAGWVADVQLWVNYDASRCDIPTATVNVGSDTCPRVTIYNNDGTVNTTIVAGGTYTLAAAASCADDTVRNSDSTYTASVVQGVVKVLSDVTITDALGNPIVSPSVINVAVPRANTFSCAELNTELTQAQRQLIQRTNPLKTGQTTSFRTGDDGDLEIGKLVNFTTLDCNNSFGNTNRFTDSVGGQTYANDYVIDHATGLGWYRITAVGTWNTAIDAAEASVQLGFSDWRISNINELISIVNYSRSNGGVSYSPFNIAQGSTTDRIWTSTTTPTVTSNALVLLESSLFGSGLKTTATFRYFFCRNHF